MIYIILASIFAAFGSYILRKGMKTKLRDITSSLTSKVKNAWSVAKFLWDQSKNDGG